MVLVLLLLLLVAAGSHSKSDARPTQILWPRLRGRWHATQSLHEFTIPVAHTFAAARPW